MEAKIQYKNERNRVRSAKILEDILIQRRAELSIQKLSARLCVLIGVGIYYFISLIISIPIWIASSFIGIR